MLRLRRVVAHVHAEGRTLSTASAFSLPASVQNPLPALMHESVLTTVGKTPVIKLQRLAPEGVNVYVKHEAFNPMGSLKDRLALGVLEWAEHHGQLKPGMTIVEASSGNTGIGLAMVCAVKGYPFVCVMSEAFSVERRKLMRFLGAKVVLTNAAYKGTGMVIKARELAEKYGWFQPLQFENEANAWMHTQTTGPEILEAFAGKQLDYFFTGYGTGGTLKGVAQVLKERSPATKVCVCEPATSPLLYSEEPTKHNADGTFVPHQNWRPHLFQGWTPDFIPKLVGATVEAKWIDKICHVTGRKALALSRELAQKEGLFTGVSGAGSLACALEVAVTVPKGTNILALLADTGERYLSTPLFEDVPADMNEEEKALANATENRPPPPAVFAAADADAEEFVKQTNTQNKIVMWSLQDCEFCWTLSKFLNAIGVSYKVVEIDSFEYARGNRGNKFRAYLSGWTGANTFPQLIINGKFIGGAVDACMMWKKDELQPLLRETGQWDEEKCTFSDDPFVFLPKWMTQNPLRQK